MRECCQLTHAGNDAGHTYALGESDPYLVRTPPWACHLVAVVELVCLSDPKSYAGGDSVPGGCNRTGLVEGQRPDKGQRLALQVGGWALG